MLTEGSRDLPLSQQSIQMKPDSVGVNVEGLGDLTDLHRNVVIAQKIQDGLTTTTGATGRRCCFHEPSLSGNPTCMPWYFTQQDVVEIEERVMTPSELGDASEEVPLPRITFANHLGETLVIDAQVGASVMETAKRQRIPGIRGDCGGYMQCATCHVYVHEDDLDGLPPISPTENMMLNGTVAERKPNSRLSCQLPIEAMTDLRVTLPDRQI